MPLGGYTEALRFLDCLTLINLVISPNSTRPITSRLWDRKVVTWRVARVGSTRLYTHSTTSATRRNARKISAHSMTSLAASSRANVML